MTEREKRWEWVCSELGTIKAELDLLRARIPTLERKLGEVAKERVRRRAPKAQAVYSEDECVVAREVIAKINEHAGTAIRAETSPGQLTAEGRAVVARLRKGATSWEMRLIAWQKCGEWCDDPKMGRKYCKPSTLFREAHFDTYLDEAALAYAEAEDVPVAVARRGQERKREQASIAELVKEVS